MRPGTGVTHFATGAGAKKMAAITFVWHPWPNVTWRKQPWHRKCRYTKKAEHVNNVVVK